LSGHGAGVANPLAAEAIEALKERGLKVATAEATCCGLIGGLLTSVPGSSAVFLGGVAPYSNRLKQTIGVPKEVLEEHGAVSARAADAMAMAVREWSGADVGLAETGIAGPGGGSPDRPVGLFFIAVATAGGVRCERLVFEGSREENREQCAEEALRLLVEVVAG
jgi:PncC family amidohydrolase